MPTRTPTPATRVVITARFRAESAPDNDSIRALITGGAHP